MIFNDCYNANPDSLEVAIRSVQELHAQRSEANEADASRLVLILGAMKELGRHAEEAHRHALASAQEINPDVICLVGGEEWDFVDEDKEGSSITGRSPVRRFFTTGDLLAALPSISQLHEPGTTVLLKGSRSVALETLLPALSGASYRKLEKGGNRA